MYTELSQKCNFYTDHWIKYSAYRHAFEKLYTDVGIDDV